MMRLLLHNKLKFNDMKYTIQNFSLSLLLLTFLIVGQAEAITRICPEGPAMITYENPEDFTNSCQAVEETLEFMTNNGLFAGLILDIEIVDKFSSDADLPAIYGFYSAVENKITMLSYKSFLSVTDGKYVFGEAPSSALHRSFIVHEIAHAVAHRNFQHSQPPVIAHEYIAYVVQIATLPTATRGKILADIQYRGFGEDHEIHPIYYSINPERFALKSFLHFTEPQNGMRFVTRLLTTNFLNACSGIYVC